MTSQQVSKDDQFQKLMGHVLGNQASWFTTIGLKAGLFAAIDEEGDGIGHDALAHKLGYHSRYVQVWCLGSYAFELLDWDEASGYRLAPHLSSLLLDQQDPQFMGGRTMFLTALYQDYVAFPEHLRSAEVWPRSEHDPFLLRALQALTTPDCTMITEQVLPQAPETLAALESGGRLLDIGVGGGTHLVHYAHRFPHAAIVGMESDGPSIDIARATVREAALEDRVDVVPGDANTLDEDGAYDLVTMNLALHETGGLEEYHPVYRMLAGVQLHEAIVGCGMITQGQLAQLLRGAGFDGVRVAEHSMPTRHVMIGTAPDTGH